MTRRTWLKTAVAGTIGMAVTGAPGLASAAALPRVRASRSMDLANVLGVRTCTSAANKSLYGDVDMVIQAMRRLGIQHVRERLVLPSLSGTQARNQRSAWARMSQAIPGFDVCAVLGTVDDRQGTVGEFGHYIGTELGGHNGVVGAVENGNESNAPKAPWNRGNPNRWVTLVRDRQRAMASRFRGDSRLSRIQLLSPSISGGAGLEKYRQLGNLGQYTDLGNFHYYPGNRDQSVPSYELNEILDGVDIVAPGKPVFCTETGMHNAVNSTAAMSYHPEDVAGEYAPRIPLEHFIRGIERVYIFELLNDHADPGRTENQDHYGLIHYDKGGLSPKPAYTSLQRLLGLVADPGPGHTPEDLQFSVRGAPGTYRQVLLQNRVGRHYLCMWRDVSIWDQRRNRPINVDPAPVTVELERSAAVNVHVPARQEGRLRGYAATRKVTVDLAGSVVVLEIG